MLILGRGHLERVLGVYVEHYNRQRPHRGPDLATPDGPNRQAASPSHPGPFVDATCSAVSSMSTQ